MVNLIAGIHIVFMHEAVFANESSARRDTLP